MMNSASNDLQILLQESIDELFFCGAVLSSPAKGYAIQKITIRPIEMRQGTFFQLSEQRDEKVFHRNIASEDLCAILMEMCSHFQQAVFFTKKADYHLLVSKKGKATLLKKKPSKQGIPLAHNRSKNYLLQEGAPVDFLVKLGVMNPEGKVYPKKADKFRQINRFLEIIADVLTHFSEQQTVRIIDFGCGKSYLTFALYYYLKVIKGISIDVTGLDLKKEVIAYCSSLASELGYVNLDFQVGDINGFVPDSPIDMVICLHACDTATDAALENAIRWEAKVILAVPCCQHELYEQVAQPALASLLRHGILKERFAALATDAARADILEAQGYRCQIMEFIDLEHTPKNLLIRAVRMPNAKAMADALERYRNFAAHLKIHPSLQRRFDPKMNKP